MTSDFTCATFVFAGLQVYSLLVVYSYYRDLKGEAPTVPWIWGVFTSLYLLHLRSTFVKGANFWNHVHKKRLKDRHTHWSHKVHALW